MNKIAYNRKRLIAAIEETIINHSISENDILELLPIIGKAFDQGYRVDDLKSEIIQPNF